MQAMVSSGNDYILKDFLAFLSVCFICHFGVADFQKSNCLNECGVKLTQRVYVWCQFGPIRARVDQQAANQRPGNVDIVMSVDLHKC